jgi:outer membrane protein TolC
VSQAEENVRIISEKYRAGLATSSELLDASVALLQAKTSYTGALAEEETARARLARALGTLH